MDMDIGMARLARKNGTDLAASAGLIGFCVLLWCAGIGTGKSLSYDEGVYLVSADLHADGVSLYRGVFNSQGPILLELLAAVFRVLGRNLAFARGLVVASGVVELACVGWLAHRLGRPRSAPLAVLALGTFPVFFLNARTCIAETPAMALALLAMVCAIEATRRGRWLLCAAGIAFGLACLCKWLVAPMLLPLLILAVKPSWIRAVEPLSARASARHGLLLVAALAATVVALVACYAWRPFFDQVVRFHWVAAPPPNPTHGQLWIHVATIAGQLLPGAGAIFASGIGLLFPRRSKSHRANLWLGVWLLVSVLSLLRHRALFDHHVVLLLPPLSILAGLGCADVLAAWPGFRRLSLVAAMLLVAVRVQPRSPVFLRAPWLAELRALREPVSQADLRSIAMIKATTAPGDLVVSDNQMNLFLAGRRPPLALCDTSATRIRAGYLTLDQATRASSQATLVLLETGRLAQLDGFVDFLERKFTKLGRNADLVAYGRNIDPLQANPPDTLHVDLRGPGGPPFLEPALDLRLDPEWSGQYLVAGDLNGDGKAEFVTGRNQQQVMTTVIAYRQDGSVLWRWGTPGAGSVVRTYDLPLQIEDVDGDGRPEVVAGIDRALLVLDGATGMEKRRLPFPEGLRAADCIVFAHLSSQGPRPDILIKDRYTTIWAFSPDWSLLWQVTNPAGGRTAHHPEIFDLDHDGFDEILVGFTLLDRFGKPRWDFQSSRVDRYRGHVDCGRGLRDAADPVEQRLVLTLCSANDMALLNGRGEALWEINGHHFESVDVGDVRPDVPGMEIVADEDHLPFGDSRVWIVGESGAVLDVLSVDYGRSHKLVDWNGDGHDEIVLGHARRIVDGFGRPVATLDAPPATLAALAESPVDGNPAPFVQVGDVDGDGVADILLHSHLRLCVYRNPSPMQRPRAPLGSGRNFTMY